MDDDELRLSENPIAADRRIEAQNAAALASKNLSSVEKQISSAQYDAHQVEIKIGNKARYIAKLQTGE